MRRPRTRLLLVVALVLALSTALTRWLARGPDTLLTFERVAHSEQAPEELSYRLENFQEWPKWFHSLSVAQALDGSSKAKPGQAVKLVIDPHKGPSRKFEILGQITECVPGRKLSIHLLSESSGKISRMFSSVDWDVELTPSNDVVGRERVRTQSGRARFFGRVAPKILLNQIFYPDIIALAAIAMPQPVDLVGQ
jgi:hypothetical protein